MDWSSDRKSHFRGSLRSWLQCATLTHLCLAQDGREIPNDNFYHFLNLWHNWFFEKSLWYIHIFNLFCTHLDGTGSWTLSLWKMRTSLFYVFNIMVTDGMVTQGARASAIMVLTLFSRNNLVSASKGLIEKNYDNYMKIITMIMKEFLLFFNLLWPSDSVWWHRSGSDLAQIMAWWLVISVVLWYSLEGNFTGKAPRYLSLIWTEKHQCWFYYTSASKTNISFDFRLS